MLKSSSFSLKRIYNLFRDKVCIQKEGKHVKYWAVAILCTEACFLAGGIELGADSMAASGPRQSSFNPGFFFIFFSFI